MKQKIFGVIRLISVPLILISIYLLVYLLSELFGLPSGDDFIGIVKSAFEKYGLWIVFVSALVEGFLLLGQYFPGGTIIFLGVISAGKDIPKATGVVAIVSVAFIIAYTMNYLVGKYGWYKLLVKFGLGKSLEESKLKLEKQGMNAVIFSYWEPNLASITATSAGILKIPFKKFQIYSAIGVVGWNVFWGALVYSLGNTALEIIGLKYVLVVFVVWVAIIFIKSYIGKRAKGSKQKLLKMEKAGLYVFHGSEYGEIEEFEPRQAYNYVNEKQVPDGEQAVFASSVVEYAILMAIINKTNCPKGFQSSAGTFTKGAVSTVKYRATRDTMAQLNDSSSGWVYVFHRSLFKQRDIGGVEYVRTEKVRPIEKVKVTKADLPEGIEVY